MARVRELRATKGKNKFRCCQRWACIHAIPDDEVHRAVADAAVARDTSKQCFRMYVRTLFLCSLKPLIPGKSRKNAEKTVGTYQHPAVCYGMCQTMFCLLLGIDVTTLRALVPRTSGDGRFAASDAHGLIGNTNSKKPAAKEFFIEKVQALAREVGHPQPWPLPGLCENTEVLVLPPQFTVNRMYNMIIQQASPAQALARRSFYNIFNSWELENIHVSGTERGMCPRCVKWTARAHGLRTVISKGGTQAARARVELKVLQRLMDNHTIRQRMGRELLRQVQSAIEGRPKKAHPLALEGTEPNYNEEEEDLDVEDDGATITAARAHEFWQPAVKFDIDAPFDTSKVPDVGDVECIMFDYLSSAKTPHKARETFSEFFPFQFGIDIYLFIVHNPRSGKSHFLTYDERHKSKGTNNVISCLHYYFESLQPETVHHCKHLVIFSDSCGAENKNQMVVSYFRWRVQMGYHHRVSWCFLEVGHTRFAPDTSGGLFRLQEKLRDHETHHELVGVITDSTPQTKRNVGVIVPDDAFGDWSALYKPFYDLRGISNAHMIMLEKSEKHRVVTKWRITYNGDWIGVRAKRLGGAHWSALKPKTINRKWVKDINDQILFEEWPTSDPMVPTPPPNSLQPSRVKHIHKEILHHVSESKHDWWLRMAPTSIARRDVDDPECDISNTPQGACDAETTAPSRSISGHKRSRTDCNE